jgi:hypothetical protein
VWSKRQQLPVTEAANMARIKFDDLPLLENLNEEQLKKLFGAGPRSVKLGVETLEDRMMPSTSSMAVHAVFQPATNTSSAFFVRAFDQAFYQTTPNGNLSKLAGPSEVAYFSAGLDPSGHAAVFAKFSDGSMWEHDSSGWTNLNQPMPMLQFAAVNGDHCYFEGQDHSLWEYSPEHTVLRVVQGHVIVAHTGGWQELWGANAVWGLDAVTQNNGVDVVYVKGGDNGLRSYSQGAWKDIDTPGYNGPAFKAFNSFSAWLDDSGNANVTLVETDGSVLMVGDLYQRWIPQVNPYDNVHATTGGIAYVVNTSGDGPVLQVINGNGSTFNFNNLPFTGLSQMDVAAPGDVYVVDGAGHVWELVNGVNWVQYT